MQGFGVSVRPRALRYLAAVVAVVALCLGSTTVSLPVAQGATTADLPDLQTLLPLSSFSIVNGSGGPELIYTHHMYNAGPAPLQIQPEYNSASGRYNGRQQTYVYNNGWQLTSIRKVPDAFVFHAEHSHFHYPLASFGLYGVAADGGPGALVTLSSKVGFCIDDSFIYDYSVPHAGETAVPPGSCADPTSMRGMSVAGVDEYDRTDIGQSIPVGSIPDGTYWFRALTDPYNDLVEANESNNETDVLLTISTQGSSRVVATGEVRRPDTTPPPITLTAPADNTLVSGNVTLTASAADGLTVRYLVDGDVVGTSSATSAPYTFTWNTSGVVEGEHWVAARTSDALGRTNTSSVSAVRVTADGTPPPASGSLAVFSRASVDASGGAAAPTVTNVPQGSLLLAFVSADGPDASLAQTATVTGSGLAWTLVRRTNTAAGTSEIWRAWTDVAMPSVQASSSLTLSGYHQSVELVAYTGARGVGVTGGGSATTGAPTATLTTTSDGAWVWGVGNDWDGAVARTPRSGQVIGHERVDTSIGDTFWMQNLTGPTAPTGTTVTFGDTAPTNHRWNLAVTEVLPASASAPVVDTQPPTVSITDPKDGATLTGIAQVGAVAADNVGVTSVQFKLDGANLGAPATSPPFTTTWDTRTATGGAHALTAEARDAAGNVGSTSSAVTVTVDNSAPPPALISVDKSVVVKAKGTLASPALSTSTAGEVLLAFVGFDGPGSVGSQASTVYGGGLTWTLVKRTNRQYGVSEIWSAKATGTLSNVRISAKPSIAGYDGMLNVVAFKGAAGPGVAGSSAAATGAPDIYLPGVQAGSWVWAVGNDWDRAVTRAPVSGQVLQDQWLDGKAADTFWVQSTTAPNTASGLVTIHDTSPVDDQWNYTAVELKAAPAT